MPVSETSKQAYRSLKSLSSDQLTAYNQIQRMQLAARDMENLPSRRDIAHSLGWETSRASARINDLIRYGYVKEAGKYRDRTTGMTVGKLRTAEPSIEKEIDSIKHEQPKAVSWLND